MKVTNVRDAVCWIQHHLHHLNRIIPHDLAPDLRLMSPRNLSPCDAIRHVAGLLAHGDVYLPAQLGVTLASRPCVERLGVRRAQGRRADVLCFLCALEDQVFQALARLGVSRQCQQLPRQISARTAFKRSICGPKLVIAIVEPQCQCAGLMHAVDVVLNDSCDLGAGLLGVQVELRRQRDVADLHGAHLVNAD